MASSEGVNPHGKSLAVRPPFYHIEYRISSFHPSNARVRGMPVETELFPIQTLEVNKIHQGDCIELMKQIEPGTIDLVFADPPFNIGYEYDEYHDDKDD